MNDRVSNEEALFHAAMQLAPDARAAYLERACRGDEALRRRVEALLEAAVEADPFFHQGPVRAALGEAAPSVAAEALPAAEKPGDRIGRYKLLQRIGEGGMGVVYMVEQEEPVRRRVALKLIKLGLDTRLVIARFEAERQALALMDHPNIAKVLDAGATAAGRLFFVMELVQGVPITEFCDRNHLPMDARIRLLLPVCQAIQSAHQKGIIHRDIKPTNILVTLNAGQPHPMVIDFGVAKATNQKLTEKTLFTNFGAMIGTPAYMSPEQAEMSRLDVDTRSDIYALGVVLYELLTGTTPFPEQRLRSAGYNELQRIILQEEPERPSTRLSTLPDEQRKSVAENRGATELALARTFPGDLDWIVMKCLEKDRERRYGTANGLAMDLQRHLEDQPVLARPPSRLYRFQKTVHRHRLAFAAAAAVTAALLIGLGLSTWLFLREREARRRAVIAETTASTEARKSGQIALFLEDMLAGVGPSVALGRDTKMLHEILDKTAARVGKELGNQPEVEAELRNTIGNVYEELGDYLKAEDMLLQALALRRSVWGPKHPRIAESLHDLGAVKRDQGKPAEAEALFRQALAMRRELLGNESQEVAISLSNVGVALFEQGRLAEAEEIHRQALALGRKVLGEEHLHTAASLHNLGNVILMQGKNSEAEAIFRRVVTLRKKLLGNEHPLLATTIGNLGTALWYQNRFREAEAAYRETLAMQRKLMGDEHPDVATSLHNLACVLQAQGKFNEAEPLCKQALELRRKLLGTEHRDYASTLTALAAIYQGQGRFPEAEKTQRDALALQRKALGPGHPETAVSLSNLGDILRLRGNLVEAETAQREAVGLLKQALGAEHQFVAVGLDILGNVLRDETKLAKAETVQREGLAVRRKVLGADHPEVAQSLHDLASVVRAQGHYEDAEALCREALGLRRKLLGNEHPDTIDSLMSLAGLLQERGKLAEAQTLMRESLPLCERALGDDWRLFDCRARLGGILLAEKRYPDAEPLLLAGYDGLKAREARVPARDKLRLKETAGQLAQLFDATARPDEAAQWRGR